MSDVVDGVLIFFAACFLVGIFISGIEAGRKRCCAIGIVERKPKKSGFFDFILCPYTSLVQYKPLALLVTLGHPAMDTLTSIWYLIQQKFYNNILFSLAVIVLMQSAVIFTAKLIVLGAYPTFRISFLWYLSYTFEWKEKKNAIEWPLWSPCCGGNGNENNQLHTPDDELDNADFYDFLCCEIKRPAEQRHSEIERKEAEKNERPKLFPYPTCYGVICPGFSVLVENQQFNCISSFFLLPILWFLLVVLQIIVFAAGTVVWVAILFVLYIIGVILHMSKLLSVGAIWNWWFFLWIGDDTKPFVQLTDESSVETLRENPLPRLPTFQVPEKDAHTIDTEDYNLTTYIQVIFESALSIVIQTANSYLLGTFNTLSIISISFSGWHIITTIFPFLWNITVNANAKKASKVMHIPLSVRYTDMEFPPTKKRDDINFWYKIGVVEKMSLDYTDLSEKTEAKSSQTAVGYAGLVMKENPRASNDLDMSKLYDITDNDFSGVVTTLEGHGRIKNEL